jgi:hypothetical protein
MTGWRKSLAAVVGLILTGGVMGASLAAAEVPADEEKTPNTGRVTLGLGADWASAYYFRGIANVQNVGNNVQPYAEVGFKLLEDVEVATSSPKEAAMSV